MNGIIPTKISDLVKYESIKSQDFLLITENSSSVLGKNSSSYTIFSDFYNFIISEQTSFTGSFTGSFINKNNIISGSISGSLQGSLLSTNTEASGGFSGSLQGSIVSKNVHATGSFSGSLSGKMTSENISVSGSIEGDLKASSLISKNARLSNCDFSGSFQGDCEINNSLVTGSFTGSFLGKLTSPYMIGSGSFQGNVYADSIVSKNTNIVDTTLRTNVLSASSVITDRFEGPSVKGKGMFIGTGSFYGDIRYSNNINEHRVTFTGTSSYAITSSHARIAKYMRPGSGSHKLNRVYYTEANYNIGATEPKTIQSLEKPEGTEWYDYLVEYSLRTEIGGDNTYSSAQVYFYYGSSTSTSVNSDYISDEYGGNCTGNSGQRFTTRDARDPYDSIMAHWFTEGYVVDAMKDSPTGNLITITMQNSNANQPGRYTQGVIRFTARYYYP